MLSSREQGASALQDYIEVDAFKDLSGREAAMVHISCVGSLTAYALLETDRFNIKEQNAHVVS